MVWRSFTAAIFCSLTTNFWLTTLQLSVSLTAYMAYDNSPSTILLLNFADDGVSTEWQFIISPCTVVIQSSHSHLQAEYINYMLTTRNDYITCQKDMKLILAKLETRQWWLSVSWDDISNWEWIPHLSAEHYDDQLLHITAVYFVLHIALCHTSINGDRHTSDKSVNGIIIIIIALTISNAL